ncbi:hypothetical protein BgAZ_404730 [Babesia gibsoni]|uniref:Uncharacterized protein n=1 Tax=Babesia gibsoni TaxID=33632 RepID=A0AAD8PCT0_BABGI|nr:hypothetical protein BgAZ_404730 [Babesia gibsoni]
MLVSKNFARRSCAALASDNFILCRLGEGYWLAQTSWRQISSPTRPIASPNNLESHICGHFMQDYLKERQLSINQPTEKSVSREDSHLGILESLDILSQGLEFNFDLLEHTAARKDENREVFALSATRYPKGSFSTDGSINVSLAKLGGYNNFISEARHFKAEEVALALRLYPARRGKGRYKDESKVQQLQRSLASSLPQLIEACSTSDLTKMLRQMYILNLYIGANHLSDISKKILKGLNSMTFGELIEIAFLIRSYMGNNSELCRLVICAIGNRLEKRCESLAALSADEVLKLLIPIVYLQIRHPSTKWSILSNTTLLNHLVSNVDNIDADGKADLFTVLTLSSTMNTLPENIADFRKCLASLLEPLFADISNNALERLLSVSDNYQAHFQDFSNALYCHSLTRSKTMKPTVLAEAYLKLNSKDKLVKQFQYDIGKRFVEISTPILVDLYCEFLEDGSKSMRQLQLFEGAFQKKKETLTMKDLSTILMYQSMYGKQPSRFNDIIRKRFLELKSTGKVKHDEILDVVLSMSLVGMHNDLDVWNDIDLPHLVYSTPHNILVYLGYCFLITGERSRDIWTILLERMLHECKSHTAETYEVLKVAKVFGIMEKNMDEHLLRRVTWAMQHTKSQHYSKISRQRYQYTAPIEEALDVLGLQYSRGVMIEELYEAPIYIRSHKIILDPLRDSYLHASTGLEVGDAHLRHSVWRKQGYNPFPLNEHSLRKFQTGEGGNWNTTEMADFILKVVKLPKGRELKGGHGGILSIKHHGSNNQLPLKTREVKEVGGDTIVRRLQQKILGKGSVAI